MICEETIIEYVNGVRHELICNQHAGHNGTHRYTEPKASDPFATVAERIAALQPRRQRRTSAVPDSVWREVERARERGISFRDIYDAMGEEFFENHGSMASSFRSWSKRHREG